MYNNDERLAYLLRRFAARTYSREELEEMMHLIRESPGNDPFHEVFLRDWEQYDGKQIFSPEHRDEQFRSLLENAARIEGRCAGEGIDRRQPVKSSLWPRRLWPRLARVAAVILLCGGIAASVRLWHKKEAMGSIAQPAGPAGIARVVPGANKAILTLANGSVVVLDSAHDGNLAQQGHTKIIKLCSGQLAYNVTDEKLSEVLYNTIATPRGGRYQVVLPDGSKVWLNAASSLRFPTRFTGDTREIAVTGEVFFEVAANPAKPFVVSVNDIKIQVLGTSFDVNAYDDEGAVRTTLAEGGVRISNGAFRLTLQPGEQAVVQDGTPVIRKVNVGKETAWKNGYFQFDNASIESIMRQLARWYCLDVHYSGRINKRFMATIPMTAPISQVLRVLEYTDAVHFGMNGNEITVQP